MCNTSLMLAEALQKHGVASVRFDKRGVGASAEAGADETQLRFEDYIDDVQRWIDLLADEKKYSKIIVAGHSEGSLIGMIACHQSGKAAGFISLCGAGRPIDELILEQMKRQPKSLQESMAFLLREWKQGKTVENVPPELMAIARPSLQPYMMSWIKYDPCVEVKKLAIPMMIVQGTTDIQVSLVDADNLAEANPEAKKTIIKNMDHLLKNNPTTNTFFQMLNYTNSKSPLHAELLPSILEFISESDP
jgi:alpha-beta hydrolase superfamily lysophospholipase